VASEQRDDDDDSWAKSQHRDSDQTGCPVDATRQIAAAESIPQSSCTECHLNPQKSDKDWEQSGCDRDP
jgi:hypothetical protein